MVSKEIICKWNPFCENLTPQVSAKLLRNGEIKNIPN
jgi:hypothetical protein